MLTQDQTVTRKVKELFITLKVGEQVSKEDVMAGYLNVSYYGRGASGLQAAARAYYGKDADELDESECAFLATLLKGRVSTTRGRPGRHLHGHAGGEHGPGEEALGLDPRRGGQGRPS